jgi:cytochrome oxidase Cu insertion factor (SCO1/SenC/PrrC family)
LCVSQGVSLRHRCLEPAPSAQPKRCLAGKEYAPPWARGRTNAAEWRFLTTRSQSDLRPILDAYDQAVDRKQNPADPTGPLNHTLRVFVIDPAGNIRNLYSSGTLDVRLVLADVKTLLMELPPASPPHDS